MLDEPPGADPHAGWCGDWGLETPGYPIMPDIKIKSCNRTPNNDALEAVGAWMLENYLERNYKESRTLKVKSGRVIKVTETEKSKSASICSCNFTAEVVEA